MPRAARRPGRMPTTNRGEPAMQVLTRREMQRGLPAVGEGQPCLLLEGAWSGARVSPHQVALADVIGARHAGIDDLAAEMAEQVAADGEDTGRESFSWVNVLRLRYELVKLLRVAAYFGEVCTSEPLDVVAERE